VAEAARAWLDPFGQRTENIQPLAEVKSSYTPEMGHDARPTVTVAGGDVSEAIGKLTF